TTGPVSSPTVGGGPDENERTAESKHMREHGEVGWGCWVGWARSSGGARCKQRAGVEDYGEVTSRWEAKRESKGGSKGGELSGDRRRRERMSSGCGNVSRRGI